PRLEPPISNPGMSRLLGLPSFGPPYSHRGLRGPGATIGPRFSERMTRGNVRIMDLTLIAIGLGLLAIVYGFVTSRQVLGAPAGNAKMQEIAGAIQEGAQAYLKRQYTTISMVGVVVAAIVA